METGVLELLDYKYEPLLEAPRRDLTSQRLLARHDAGSEIWHRRNEQLNLRLLEALNPKRQNFLNR